MTNPTLNALIVELGEECQTTMVLIHQFQLPNLSASQQAAILPELFAMAIHLQTRCDEDF